jgi:hypothetical protein
MKEVYSIESVAQNSNNKKGAIFNYSSFFGIINRSDTTFTVVFIQPLAFELR